MAGFAVRHPSGQMVHPYQWQANSDYTDGQSTGGYYSGKFIRQLVKLLTDQHFHSRSLYWQPVLKVRRKAGQSLHHSCQVRRLGEVHEGDWGTQRQSEQFYSSHSKGGGKFEPDVSRRLFWAVKDCHGRSCDDLNSFFSGTSSKHIPEQLRRETTRCSERTTAT